MGRAKAPTQVSTLTDPQQQLLSLLTSGLAGAVPGGLEAIGQAFQPESVESLFQEAVAQPALRGFQAETIPSILQAQANLGAKGGSAIERQLAVAGRDLEQMLGQQRVQFQLGQRQQGLEALSRMLGLGLGTQAFALQQPGLSPGAQIGSQLAGSALQALPFFFL